MLKENPIQTYPNGGFPPIQKKNKLDNKIIIKSAGFKKKFAQIK
jgi:hypothetical protein